MNSAPAHGIRRELLDDAEVGARAEGAAGRGQGHDGYGGIRLDGRAGPIQILEQLGVTALSCAGRLRMKRATAPSRSRSTRS